MVYRVSVAIFFIANITVQLLYTNLGAKWFIYMTDQGLFLLTLHFLIDACMVIARWNWERSNPGHEYHKTKSMSFVYKFSWALNTITFNIALTISIIYWGVLHHFVDEKILGLMFALRGNGAVILNVLLHGANTIACLIDIFISARPWKKFHFAYAMIFGCYYLIFNLSYYAFGGVGFCYDTKEGNPGASVQQGQKWCDPFIYPIMDWHNIPWISAKVVSVAFIFVPLYHFLWMGLVRSRKYICSKNSDSTTSPAQMDAKTS